MDASWKNDMSRCTERELDDNVGGEVSSGNGVAGLCKISIIKETCAWTRANVSINLCAIGRATVNDRSLLEKEQQNIVSRTQKLTEFLCMKAKLFNHQNNKHKVKKYNHNPRHISELLAVICKSDHIMNEEIRRQKNQAYETDKSRILFAAEIRHSSRVVTLISSVYLVRNTRRWRRLEGTLTSKSFRRARLKQRRETSICFEKGKKKWNSLLMNPNSRIRVRTHNGISSGCLAGRLYNWFKKVRSVAIEGSIRWQRLRTNYKEFLFQHE